MTEICYDVRLGSFLTLISLFLNQWSAKVKYVIYAFSTLLHALINLFTLSDLTYMDKNSYHNSSVVDDSFLVILWDDLMLQLQWTMPSLMMPSSGNLLWHWTRQFCWQRWTISEKRSCLWERKCFLSLQSGEYWKNCFKPITRSLLRLFRLCSWFSFLRSQLLSAPLHSSSM